MTSRQRKESVSMSERGWYTPEDVAATLQVDLSDVVALIRSGRLAGGEVTAGNWRVSPAALRRYLRDLERPRSMLRKRLGAMAAAVLVLGSAVTATTLRAALPAAPASAVLPYQGYLEEGGEPAEGSRFVTFRLFPDRSATEATWSETVPVTLVGGRFVANLGATVSLDDVLRSGADLYLELAVDDAEGGGEPVTLVGRQLLGSVPFARRGAPGQDFTVDGDLRTSGDVTMSADRQLRSAGTLHVSGQDLQLTATSGALRMSGDESTPVHLDVEGSSSVLGELSAGTLSVVDGATVNGVLNANGRLNLGGTQLTCLFMASCPSSWVERGTGGFIQHNSRPCPFTQGGAYNDWWSWCHPALCCNQ
jgi:hypothetical protein